MAYVEYSELSMPSKPAKQSSLVVMDIELPCQDAYKLRQALVREAGVGVLRCVPKLSTRDVCFEVLLPLNRRYEVMACVLNCVQAAKFGRTYCWHGQMQRHPYCQC